MRLINKKLLIIVATHGDEKIGIEVVEKLKAKKLGCFFDSLVANPRALEKGIRFTEADLNRSYPGMKNSKFYEKRRACEIFKLARKYKYVVDIHEAITGINNFIIAPREKLYKIFPIGLLDIKAVLLWPDPKGPLGQFLKNVVELEFGMRNKKRKTVIGEATKIMGKFIINIYAVESAESFSAKEFYYVYGKLKREDYKGKISSLKDFREASINKETFFSLLVGGYYLKQGIVCYKMRKLEIDSNSM